MPKLLFLSHRLPYPPHSGADIRTYNVWRELAKDWDIDAIVVHNRAEDIVELSMSERQTVLSEIGDVDIVPMEAQESLGRTLAAHAKALLRGAPYVEETFRGRRFSERLAHRLGRDRYDIAHVDSIALLHTLPILSGLPVVLTHHNIESDLLDRRAGFAPKAAVRAYLRLQARRLRAAEAYWAPRVALNLCVSDEDTLRLREIAPGANVATIPNGVVGGDPSPASIEGRRRSGLFVGGLNWFPNEDALAFFAQDIEPLFQEKGVEFPTAWVGKANETQIAAYSGHRSIQAVGYAPDLSAYMNQARVFIAPLRVGGGTRLKILDAWAAGIPVVATTLACEGLGATDGAELLIGDTPEEFVERVQRLLTDDALWYDISTRARDRLRAGFTWSSIGAQLRARYAEVSAARQ